MKKLSLVRSLLLFSMLTSGVGLLLFCAGFLIFDLHSFRAKKVYDLKSTADLLSSNANSALGFGDSEAGNQIVEAMRVRPGIRTAILYTLDNKILAWYVRRDLTGNYAPPKEPPVSVLWSPDALSFSETVFLEGRPVGTVYLEDDLSDVHDRMIHFAWTSTVMALACLFFVYLLSLRLRQTVARPVYGLAEVARKVASGNNYSLRAEEGPGGELGQLSADFNYMLGEIERRDAELMVARQTLEQRVAERTEELESEIAVRHRTEGHLLEAKEAAEAANRAKSEFLANMSHEIRTPLNGVMGMTDLVLESELTDEQRDYLDTVKISADSLLTVINDILDFSKIEAGKIDLEFTDFNLRDCLEATLRTVSLRADEKGLELLCEVAADVPEVVTGETRLRQVVVNLVGNAIKFTSEGEVALRVQCDEQEGPTLLLHFTVVDTGIGIPTEKQKIIFNPFTQADASTTRRYGGTGLGLTISTRLVEMMNGRIWVVSEIGRGTEFHFTAGLGRADKKTVPLGNVAPPELLRGVKVLVVDVSTAAATSKPPCSKPRDSPPAPANRSMPMGLRAALFSSSVREEIIQPSQQSFRFLQLALPHREHRPAHPLQLSHDTTVARHIAGELRFPKLPPRFGRARIATVSVPMPETSMYEHDFASSGKNQIRAAGQCADMHPIAVPETADDFTDGHLRACILRMDRRHDERAFLPIDMIRHTLRPREQRPLFRDVLLRRLSHHPRKRHFLFLGDGFESLVDGRWKTDRCADGRSALHLHSLAFSLFHLHAEAPMDGLHHITPHR